MWPFRKPLHKRIRQEIETLLEGWDEFERNLRAAISDGLPRATSSQARASRLVLEIVAATERLSRDVLTLTRNFYDLQQRFRAKPYDHWTLSEKVELQVMSNVVIELTEPIRRFLKLIEWFRSLPSPPGEAGAPIIDERLEGRLRTLLETGENFAAAKEKVSIV